MPLRSRARSSDSGAAILIAAASGRALAAAARRAGYRPFVLDFFGDADTRMICAASRCIEGGSDTGFAAEDLIPALTELAAGEEPRGAVYGTGFEDRPELLSLIAKHWPIFGNKPEAVRRAKDPVQLSLLCAGLRIPHPEISLSGPADHENWLAKSAGGAGGMHVLPAAATRAHDPAVYFQRKAEGEPVSVQFLTNGAETVVIGLSRQWAAPAPGAPFRFGGILRPISLSSNMELELRQAAAAMARALGLLGLNTIDFLATNRAYTLIEINPRPGAALDIFDDEKGSLFKAHVNACLGRLPDVPLPYAGAAAAAIAYTPYAIASMPELNWPDWSADWQSAKSALRAGDPLCTVMASAKEPEAARTLAQARINLLLSQLPHMQSHKSSHGRKPPFE
jgi:uncharacterized protein